MDLVEAFRAEGAAVAFVGAGGKKTAMYALANRLDGAVVTATVRIPIFDPYVATVFVSEEPLDRLRDATAVDFPLGLVPARERADRYLGYDLAMVDGIVSRMGDGSADRTGNWSGSREGSGSVSGSGGGNGSVSGSGGGNGSVSGSGGGSGSMSGSGGGSGSMSGIGSGSGSGSGIGSGSGSGSGIGSGSGRRRPVAGGSVGSVLIKADGARMRNFKAPGEAEPQIPSSADVVVPVASASVVGEPLTEEHVHRPERVARVARDAGLDVTVGETVTPEMIGTILASTNGGLKGVPDGASVIPLVNKVDDDEAEADARAIAAAFYDRLGTDAAAAPNASSDNTAAPNTDFDGAEDANTDSDDTVDANADSAPNPRVDSNLDARIDVPHVVLGRLMDGTIVDIV